MTGHERGDPFADGGPPEREQIPPNEIDLTGVINQRGALVEVISHALANTSRGDIIPSWGARAIARLLANDLDDAVSALHQFAVTGRGDFVAIGSEIAEIIPDANSFTRESINQLGAYLIAAHDQAQHALESTFTDETRQLIAQYGPAYAAYLTLPDLTEDDGPDVFHSIYEGSCDSIDDIARTVADAFDVEQRLKAARLDGLARPDRELLMKLATQRWNIVHYDGKFHLFDK